MPRNILIDPQRLGTSNPNIQFSGSSGNTIKLEVLSEGSVQFSGSVGSLLKVSDLPVGGGPLLSLFVSGTSTFTGSILPGVTSLYDLGTTTYRWNNLVSNSLTGSLTKLPSGVDYLVAGSGISITTGSNGQVTISNDGTVGDITAVNAGTGLLGGGTSGAVTLSINDSVVATISGSTFTGAVKFNAGLSGSLTKLSSGGDYLLAGTNISLTTGSNGAVTIAAPNLAPSTSTFVTIGNDSSLSNERALTAGTGIRLTDAGSNSTVTLGINDSVVATISGSTFSGVANFNAGLSGSLTKLTTGADYLLAGAGISITTGSSGQITITNDGTVGDITAVNAGTGLTGGGTSGAVTLAINDSVVATISGATFNGSVKFNQGLTGSLTKLATGSDYLIAGSNISLTTGSSGAVTIAAPNLAPSTSAFVTIGNDATLSNERSLTAGTGIRLTDAGANSTVTLGINDSVVATISGSTFSGVVNFNTGLSGSLTKLTSGSDYLIAGSNVSLTTGSTGAVTISAPNLAPSTSAFVTIGNDTTLSNERSLTAGTGIRLTDAGANSTVTLGINDSVVATISGSTFTGAVKFNAGLSGSLTKLTTGGDYLLGGQGISLTTGSSGAVSIATTGASTVAGNNSEVQFNNNGNFGSSSALTFNNTTNSLTSSYVIASTGFSGSLTRLSSGASYLVGGTGVLVTSGSNGQVTHTIDNTVVATISGSTFTGAVKFNSGLSGSLTKLSTGVDYLVAGSGISIITGANGQITLANDGTVGDITAVNAGNGLLGGGTSGAVTLTIDDSKVATISGSTFTGAVKFNAGLSGSLTKLASGSDYLLGGANIALTTGSSGAVTISAVAAGSNTQVQFNDAGFFGGNSSLTYNKSVGALTGAFVSASTGFSGSLTKLANGSDYLVAGTNIALTTGSSGNVTISTSGLPSVNAQYLTLATDASLTNERTFAVSTGIKGVDSGANNNYTVSIDDSVVATISGSTFTGAVKFNAGLSGSLTKLSTGADYLLGGANIALTTGSSGAVTIAATASGNNSQIQFNNGGNFGASSGLTFNNTTQALTSTYVIASTGFSGSLTKLSTGNDYLVAGNSISLTTGSSGNVTIAWSAPTNSVTGVGTTNYVTKWTSTSTMGNSVIYDDGTNVGVGTSAATLLARLYVTGSSVSTSPVVIFRPGITSQGILETQDVSGATVFSVSGSSVESTQPFRAANGTAALPSFSFAGSNSTGMYRRTSNQLLNFSVGGSQAMGIDTNGNVGINVSATQNPGGTLHVSVSSTASTTTALIRGGNAVASGPILDVQNNLNTSLFFVSSSGNIGIGITTTGDRLAVVGNVSVTGSYIQPGQNNTTALGSSTKLWNTVYATNLTGSLTTLSNGTAYLLAGTNITLATGSSGAVTIGWSAPVGSVTGTGTNNYVTKWTGTSTLGSGVIFDNGTNVGIGTTLLDSKLVVGGNSVFSGSVNPAADNNLNYVIGTSSKRWSNVVATSFSGSLTKLSDGTTNYLQAGTNVTITTGSNGAITINSTTAAGVVTGTGINNYTARWTGTGTLSTGALTDDGASVGVGTASPATKLSVYGGALSANYGVFSGSLASFASATGALYTYFTNNTAVLSANVDNSNNPADLDIFTGPTRAMRINTSQNVGIGTVTYTARLHVSGTSTSSDPVVVLRAGVPTPTGKILDVKNQGGTTVASIDHLGNLVANTGSFGGDLSISGNLTVLGSSSIINSTIVNIGDNIINLNTQSPTLSTGGLYVSDTTANTTGSIIWDASTDRWKAGFVNQEINIVTTGSSDNLHNKTIPITGTPSSNISGGTTGGVGYFDGSTNLKSTAAGTSGQLLQSAGSSVPTWTSFSTIISANNVLTGSGTTNYLSKFTSGNALGNSIVYDDGTNVGIGTSGPGARLHVTGSSTASDQTLLVRAGTPNQTGPVLEVENNLGTSLLIVSGSGRVGVGSSIPTAIFDVWDVSSRYAGLRIGDFGAVAYNTYWANTHEFRNNTLVGAIITTIDNSGLYPGSDLNYDLGLPSRRWKNIYAGNISGSLTGSNVSAGQVVVAGTGGVLSGSNNFVWDNTNVRVGIGTATPSVRLHVSDSQSSATVRMNLANTSANGGPLRIGYFPDSAGFHITSNGNPAHTNVPSTSITNDYATRTSFEILNQNGTWNGSTGTQGWADFRFGTSGNGALATSVRLQTDGKVGIGTTDFSYTVSDNTPLVGSFTNNRMYVNGSIQLNGNDDAIVFGRGTSTFLKDEEIGFGWGSGWYQTDSTWLRVRNSASIRSDVGGAYIQGNVSIGSSDVNGNKLSVNGEMAITGSILPHGDNARDLGSASKRWRGMFAASGSFSTLVTTAATTSGSYSKTFAPGESGRLTATITSLANENKFIDLNATNGAYLFDIMFVASEGSFSVAKKYTVACQYGQNPVSFKTVDTGPYSGYDITVTFSKPGLQQMRCTFSHNYSLSANVAITMDIAAVSTGATATNGTVVTIFA